jgi:hypothetical protein
MFAERRSATSRLAVSKALPRRVRNTPSAPWIEP